MANLKIILLLFIVAGRGTSLPAQNIERFNSFSYNVNEGLLQSHVDDMAFDQNNFAWLSFANGIQKFDGNSFTEVPVQAGLPDDKGVVFFTTSKGHLLISHSQGISKYEISNNRFRLIYRNDTSWGKPVSFLGEDNNNVYFFTGDAAIAAMDINTFAITSQIKTGFKDYKNDAYGKLKYTNIVNHCIGLYADSSLVVWDLVAKKIIKQAKNTLLTTVFDFWLSNLREILYISNKKDNRLMKYNFKTGENKTIAIYPGGKNKSERIVFFKWKNKYHLSYFEKVYETDFMFSTIIKELKNFQNEPVTNNFVTNIVRVDNLGNLYLLTANNGIRKIINNNYPLNYYGTDKSRNNFIVSICTDKSSNRLLAGTQGNGVLIFDTLQHLVKQIRSLPGEKEGFTPVCIVKLRDGAYLFFCWGQNRLWKLDKKLQDWSEVAVAKYGSVQLPVIDYFSNLIFENESMCMMHTRGATYKINLAELTVLAAAMPVPGVLSCTLYDNNLVTHSNDQLNFIDPTSMNIVRRIPLKNTGGVRCFAVDKEGNLYVGSNKGIFKLNTEGKLLWQVNKNTGLPDECIYAMVFDEMNVLWCSTNKGIFRLNEDKSIFQLTKDDGLQENEFNTNVVAKSNDGELFFGGVNGVNSFFPSAINNSKEEIKLLVTHIKINNKEVYKDTAVWNVNDIDLPYNQNSLAFDFIAMASSNPGQYIYQYRMTGIDEEWIQNNNLQTVRYFLPPGNYVLQLYASRFFNKEAKAMKKIYITIHPPFWKAWWFIAGLSILLVFLLAITINQYNRREYRKKIKLFAEENKMRLERERISRDLHDNIGAYANAVLYNTELLGQQQNETMRDGLIRDLRFASKDIITSLRETVWALKQDNYTAEDCLVRIRNFIQPFTRYYPHVHFKVEGDVPKDKILQYDKALNIVRIAQEAVSNAIKHANANNISIYSSDESGQWKLIITDDGVGFDYEEEKELKLGNGLNNMSQRSIDAGLLLTISSIKGSGSIITITC